VDTNLIKTYARLRRQQAASEAEAGAIKTQADELEVKLIEAFSEEGLQNTKIEGQTIYLRRDLFAQRKPGVEAEELEAALVKAGLEHFIKPTVSMQSLSAYLRDLDKAEEDLPDELAAVVQGFEKFSVRVTKG
jgi:hypothetical protein